MVGQVAVSGDECRDTILNHGNARRVEMDLHVLPVLDSHRSLVIRHRFFLETLMTDDL